ncbi:MAG TPA: hypothetical protein VN704_10315 [Verrucomicrobiae bacterium]|nr:hypothetical protein [Verrucomicrobiae bacterium]
MPVKELKIVVFWITPCMKATNREQIKAAGNHIAVYICFVA